MKSTPAFALIALLCLFGGASALRAQKEPPKLYAQELVDWVMSNHPELEHCTIHAFYPGRQVYTSGLVGVDHKGAQAGDDDDTEDYAALTTGKPNYYHYEKHNKNLWKAVMPLLDRKGTVVGELTLRQQYTTAADEKKVNREFRRIRDQLKIRIPSQKSLFDTGKTVTKNYAQSLVDYILVAYPGIDGISFHVFAPGAPVMASSVVAADKERNVGEDEDEENFAVLTTGKPSFYQTPEKDLYKGLLLVNDQAGRQVGVILVRYPYTTKEDEPKWKEKIEAIRNWLQLHIPSKAALYEPADQPIPPKHS